MFTRGSHAILEILVKAGVRYLFENPGTTELPLLNALAHDFCIDYILGLQEISVLALPDGYAQAPRNVGVVNRHVVCGLDNGNGHVLQRPPRRMSLA